MLWLGLGYVVLLVVHRWVCRWNDLGAFASVVSRVHRSLRSTHHHCTLNVYSMSHEIGYHPVQSKHTVLVPGECVAPRVSFRLSNETFPNPRMQSSSTKYSSLISVPTTLQCGTKYVDVQCRKGQGERVRLHSMERERHNGKEGRKEGKVTHTQYIHYVGRNEYKE